MAHFFKDIRLSFFDLIPLLLIFIISLNGISIIEISIISINLHYIIVYFWVLRKPNSLGYGYIFLSGIIADVLYGTPLGSNALALLFVAGFASYIRVVTVNISLINDWVGFVPTVLFANFVYFFSLFFIDYPIDYMFLFKSSIFTLIFYPFMWGIFTLISNFMKR